MELQDPDGGASQQTRYEALRQASGVIASQASLDGVLENLARFLPSVVSFEFLGVVLHDAQRQVFRLHALDGSVSPKSQVGTEIPEAECPVRVILEDQKPILINDTEKEAKFADLDAV
jgi:transcriptional regulator with GAF, ATPase, and Fis domain